MEGRIDFGGLSDRQLWKEIAGGNQYAFSFLYETTSDALFSYGYKFSSEKSLIEDVIQDVFVIIWEKRDRLDISHSIKFYLFTTFRREMLTRLQGDRGHREELGKFHEESYWEASIQEVLIQRQMTMDSGKHVREAMKILTNRQREVIYLKYLEGLSYEEISEMMDVKVPYLYNLVLKGLKSLKSHFVSTGILNTIRTIFIVLIIKSF
ncbi:sigma-70 family RNA polymerase sigma factor [Echinicola marina]|uniref:RNA polymerase sigma factor n=1 Tax=Echinicola marina TaxID=2859768 RepID=UPI001CF6080B|nr:sigma-70 family RNA polymerase sigma factor [Echinicola marina]UCS91502.1 sigma-70 family RNA polymerase sigma factor [Echinicola marina]